MLKEYFRNPISLWIKYIWQKIHFERIHKSKHLKIGYMSFIDNVLLGKYNTLYEHVVLKNVTLDDFTYIAKNSEIMNTKIGKFCSIGERCKIGLGIHPIDAVSTHPVFYSTRSQSQMTFVEENVQDEYKEITIGHDVWIGYNVTILDGIQVNNGAVIAAGSVVNKDVPAYAIVGGIPAKIIRYRFLKSEGDSLEDFKWWDQEIDWLKEHCSEFSDKEIFLRKHIV